MQTLAPLRAILPFALLLASCSLLNAPSAPLPPRTKDLASLELFLARSELHRTEFEHYKLDGSLFFYECGEIRRGRHAPVTQAFVQLPGERLNQFAEAAWQLVAPLEGSTPDLPEPGDNNSFADPGQLFLNAQFGDATTKLKTSVDSISPPAGATAPALRELVELVRGAVPENLCGNAAFYGVERK